MNRKFYHLALVALVAFAFSSCGLFNNKPEYHLSDLQGLWLENGDTVFGHYVRFTTEASEEMPYLFGREWTESDDVHEEDLIQAWDSLGVHGNGWFKYKLETAGELTEIHLMDNGGAELPKVYILSKLTDTDLQYYEKDNEKWKYSFSRIVETKK